MTPGASANSCVQSAHIAARILLAVTASTMAASCRSRESNDTADVGASVEAQVVAPVVTTTQPSRRGMVWIPPGVLVMGTPPGTVPRLADEELPGVDIPMTGYFIDKLPYPNETGAIATTNVSRDEAERMCASLDKRLCTESEWERACKGPAQDRYVGGSFAPATCGVGVPADRSALSPRGSLPGCVSGFGVSDMHGGAFEWTFSLWRRSGTGEQGVVRGGNAVLPQGEIVSRCANAAPKSLGAKGATIGFRCCAGERNDVEVVLKPSRPVVLERVVSRDGMPVSLRPLAKTQEAFRAWRWRPSLNDELLVHSGCATIKGPCDLVVSREVSGAEVVVVSTDVGRSAGEVQLFDSHRTLRATYMDPRGRSRLVHYDVGRVTISDPAR